MSSTADADEVVEVSEGGLTVEKSFTADEFPVPAIRFEIETAGDEAVSFRLVERIPESFPMDGVGFHPEYHSENWTAFQDNHVEFSGTVEPDEPLVTVYGIRLDEETEPAEFLTEPAIAPTTTEDTDDDERDAEEVDDTTIDDILASDRNQVVKDMLAGTGGVPGLDDQGDDGEEEPEITLDLERAAADAEPSEEEDGPGEQTVDDEEEPEITLDIGEAADDESDGDTADATADAEPADDESDGDTADATADAEPAEWVTEGTDEDEVVAAPPADTDPAPATAGDEPVGARLAAELRAGTLEETDVEVLRRELELDGEGAESGMTASERARIDHLVTRVEEIGAYANALEAFIDENGRGEELIGEFRTELESFGADLETLRDRVDEATGSVGDLSEDLADATERTETLEADVGEIDDRLERTDERADELESGLERVESSVDELDERLEDVRADVTEITEWRAELGSMFSG
ncbi:AAA family ATPase [Natronobiforma cellulositropha]|uniref:AAA family ATPase n=1 Tax=Natronobiforma cellulositropha TaxID=1679076 RepID=UPI0021D5AEE9|nr:AAA family ATPase [Natronobiforma cellulositropha]